jgi:hypothetical protein
MVDAFMGNYPVTYNQPDKFSLDRNERSSEMKIICKQKLHGKFGAHIHRTETPHQTLALPQQIDALAEIETYAPSDIITSQILSLTDSQHSVKFLKL